MGLMSVLKKVLAGVEVAGEVANQPEMETIETAFPSPWLSVGLSAVRIVSSVASDYERRGRPMDDEAKRAEFARTFRAELPEEKASDGDLATLAGLLVKLEKSEVRAAPSGKPKTSRKK